MKICEISVAKMTVPTLLVGKGVVVKAKVGAGGPIMTDISASSILRGLNVIKLWRKHRVLEGRLKSNLFENSIS